MPALVRIVHKDRVWTAQSAQGSWWAEAKAQGWDCITPAKPQERRRQPWPGLIIHKAAWELCIPWCAGKSTKHRSCTVKTSPSYSHLPPALMSPSTAVQMSKSQGTGKTSEHMLCCPKQPAIMGKCLLCYPWLQKSHQPFESEWDPLFFKEKTKTTGSYVCHKSSCLNW